MLPAPRKPVLIVAGPTGSGKSALALAVAETFGGTVINADAMQVYRELKVLTARPGADEEARVPHRLYGIVPAAERCSAGRWLEMALAEIEVSRAAGRLPIVVGGSGLYLNALTGGLSAVPPVPDETRDAAEELYDRLGGEAFRHMLAGRDPAAARRLAAGDRQRMIRAFAVATATGRALSEWHALMPPDPGLPEGAAVMLLMPDRAGLYASLDARFAAMLDQGAVAEVRALLELGLDPGLPAMKAVGVRELAGYLRGEASLDEAAAAARMATRRYAKRQYTWLRHQLVGDCVINAQYSPQVEAQAFAFVRQALLTPRG